MVSGSDADQGENTVVIENLAQILKRKKESFVFARCINGHRFDRLDAMTDNAFLVMRCPFLLSDRKDLICGATLEISFSRISVIAPQ